MDKISVVIVAHSPTSHGFTWIQTSLRKERAWLTAYMPQCLPPMVTEPMSFIVLHLWGKLSLVFFLLDTILELDCELPRLCICLEAIFCFLCTVCRLGWKTLCLAADVLLLVPVIPSVIADIPLCKACRPACLRRGVACRMIFFRTRPTPCPLW